MVPTATALFFTADAAGLWARSREEVCPTSLPPNFDLEQCLDDYVDVPPEWVDRVAEKRAELAEDEAVQDYFADETDLDGVWGPTARAETQMNVRGVLRYLDQRD